MAQALLSSPRQAASAAPQQADSPRDFGIFVGKSPDRIAK